jgi:hypothetical protein
MSSLASPKEKAGRTLAEVTEREDYGPLHALARLLQSFVKRSAEEVVFLLEAFCARIETKRELRKWNRALERSATHERHEAN